MPQSHRNARYSALRLALALALSLGFASTAAQAESANKVLPMPAVDMPTPASDLQTATFAGGCFWGVQAIFQHVDGVDNAVSGYAGGITADANYERVSTGTTRHAEAVRVTYEPSKISYGKLLQIFFSVAIDPTQVDRQGNDIGPHYRSVLFITDPAQEKVARAYLQQLAASNAFDKPIATQIDTTSTFYPAEPNHQDYFQLHPNDPYIVENDMPRVKRLQALFPAIWRPTPITTKNVTSSG
jgi:peptide-methionine (S)-S-oxide reductase